MGVGHPIDLRYAVEHGIDMLDCVLPTRNARHGTGWVSPDGVFSATAFATGWYNWEAFQGYSQLDEARWALRLPGKIPQQVLLVRRNFESEDDWLAARAMIRPLTL